MKSIQFTATVPRYVFGLVLGALTPAAYVGPFSCTRYRDLPVPPLPGPDWVRVRTRYGGICGSDLGTIRLHSSPSLSPFVSPSFVLGHEQVGTVAEVGPEVDGLEPGQRVVADPVLSCPTRGIDPPCPACQAGEWSRCERFAEGNLSPGMLIGDCADTGGSWSPAYVAHRSQLYPVPDAISDENALLIEPFCSALHPVMRVQPADGETVLVIGAGTIGLCVVAALRALGSAARVIVVARHRFQGKWARHYGADEVVHAGEEDVPARVAELTGARLYKPILGKRMMVGGADVVYECAGADDSIDDALRFTRAGGRLALVGLAGRTKRVDWTSLWFEEVNVQGCFCYSSNERYQGRLVRPFALALEWMAAGVLDLSPLLTHTFALEDYRQALHAVMYKSRYELVKAAFVFER
jgi:threonine dehydrogenase-like Zn-dependent dehydrogenase